MGATMEEGRLSRRAVRVTEESQIMERHRMSSMTRSPEGMWMGIVDQQMHRKEGRHIVRTALAQGGATDP